MAWFVTYRKVNSEDFTYRGRVFPFGKKERVDKSIVKKLQDTGFFDVVEEEEKRDPPKPKPVSKKVEAKKPRSPDDVDTVEIIVQQPKPKEAPKESGRWFRNWKWLP